MKGHSMRRGASGSVSLRATQKSESAKHHLRCRRLVLVGAVIGAFSLAACDTQPEYCSAVDEAQQSFQELKSTNVIEDGTNVLEDRFQTFSSDAKSLIAAARDEFQTETDALRASLQQSKEVLEGLGEDAAQAAPLVSSTIQDLQTSTRDLFDEVAQACE